jgi:hypothetical protein
MSSTFIAFSTGVEYTHTHTHTHTRCTVLGNSLTMRSAKFHFITFVKTSEYGGLVGGHFKHGDITLSSVKFINSL